MLPASGTDYIITPPLSARSDAPRLARASRKYGEVVRRQWAEKMVALHVELFRQALLFFSYH
jgi:hypothetical protein